MKKNFLVLFLCIFIFSSLFTLGQEASDTYRRSSICMLLMDDPGMPKRDTIMDAFLKLPVPDKYNDHNVNIRYFDPSKFVITAKDKEAYKLAVAAAAETSTGEKKKKGGFGAALKEVASAGMSAATGKESTAMFDNTDKETHAINAHKYLLEQNVAKQLFDNWFINEDGEFHIELVKERGLYDATLEDVLTARNTVRGMGMLEDAGEELINNTFVVVSRYRYMSKDELSKEIEAMTEAVGSQIGEEAKAIASLGSMVTKYSLGAGYYVRTTSFLFQLNWNEEIANKFYSELWDDHEKYNASDIFTLKYIGQESAWANVKAGVFTNKSESELIRIATVNATDAVLAKLEKKYDVFKTKTPLLSVSPFTAAIGMKEGVSPGDKFDVLERVVDPNTNRTTYKKKGQIKASKNKIWDNRYMASEELKNAGEEQNFNVTEFEGNTKGLYPGMLLRQAK